MTEIIFPEVMSVSTESVVVTFNTEGDERVATRVGNAEVVTTGPQHIACLTGLEPGTHVEIEVEGARPSDDPQFPSSVRTLERPAGELLASIATVNDVHFGETVCGRIHTASDEEMGAVSGREGEEPYPQKMNRAAISEITAFDGDAVIVKGDLTNAGTWEEYQQFLDAYGQLGDRMYHTRGNHDAMLDSTMALNGAPFAVVVNGVTFAVIDTVRPGTEVGQITRDQIAWIDDCAANTSGAVFVFGHHNLWDLDSEDRSTNYFGINPDDSEAFGAVVAQRENIVGYFAGHTHRHRVRRSTKARSIPFVEVGSTKDYPGVWGEYQIYEGGYTQVSHRFGARDAMDWAERTRFIYAGLYRDYSLGLLEHRSFTQIY